MVPRYMFSMIACLTLTACGWWGVEASGPAYVEVSTAPVEIETAPSVVYEGHPTYLYQDRWYYREGPRWRYYRNEPGVLIEHRRRFSQQPPRHQNDRPNDGPNEHRNEHPNEHHR